MSVRLFALGGLGEVGMNCLAIEQDDQLMLIDCGVTFGFRDLGVDIMHPDFSALEAWRDRIAGLVITHGHEDHIGAVPYFLSRFDVPVWAPPYARELLAGRAREHEVLRHARFELTRPREKFRVGPFEVEPIRVTHSIADATSLAIQTRAGTVIHTGDFKFDPTPPDGELFDEERFAELGREGVSLLMSDSTNIDAAGTTASEAEVGDALLSRVSESEGAVVVALFASNVHRLRLLGDIAQRTGRRLVPMGRSVLRHLEVARDTGYLALPSDLVWPAHRVAELPRERVLAVATGTQGEPRGALARIARGEHSLKLEPRDTVILSSRTIPGNEHDVQALMAQLYRSGARVVSWGSDRSIHTSGHAHCVEQRRMLELVRPKSFVPLHGTLHHLNRHAALASETGVDNALVLENGEVAELDGQGVRKVGKVHAGRVFCWAGKPIGEGVLRDRRALAAEGVVMVVLEVDEGLGCRARVNTRGVIDEASDGRTLADASRAAADAWRASASRDAEARQEAVRLAVRRVFQSVCGMKPVVLVTVTGDLHS